jgi:hypothetical protein
MEVKEVISRLGRTHTSVVVSHLQSTLGSCDVVSLFDQLERAGKKND